MAERPILFNAEMVRAILVGRKTQTRRTVKPQPGEVQQLRDGRFEASPDGGFDHGVTYLCCPLGQPGDRLWVRETWDADYPTVRYGADNMFRIIEREEHLQQLIKLFDTQRGEWRPSIHMPRWASRITLEITDVRVQRVQEISEADAEAEGAEPITGLNEGGDREQFGDAFVRLWSSVYGAESWTSNAWVWAVTFRRVEGAR